MGIDYNQELPQFFPVKDSTYQPDNEGKIFRFHRPEKYDYHTLTQLGAEWPATAVTNSEVATPSMQKIPSLQMDGIFTYQLGFSGNTLTYIVFDDCFGIITKYGRITPGDVIPKGYPVRHVKKIASWGYRMPLGKGWYTRFNERPHPGVEVVSIFKFQKICQKRFVRSTARSARGGSYGRNGRDGLLERIGGPK